MPPAGISRPYRLNVTLPYFIVHDASPPELKIKMLTTYHLHFSVAETMILDKKTGVTYKNKKNHIIGFIGNVQPEGKQ